jgi:transcriptional regulator with XRE-family HTH domain
VSQVELAELIGIKQAAISKIERRSDISVSTLRRLVNALGGELELNARFPDHTVSIGVGSVEDHRAASSQKK